MVPAVTEGSWVNKEVYDIHNRELHDEIGTFALRCTPPTSIGLPFMQTFLNIAADIVTGKPRPTTLFGKTELRVYSFSELYSSPNYVLL